MRPGTIVKRDGRVDHFDPARIALAIGKSLAAVNVTDQELAAELGLAVVEHLDRTCDRSVVDLESVQDAVLHVLQESGNYQAAIAYARYRDERERQRRATRVAVGSDQAPNLVVMEEDGHRHRWTREWLLALLIDEYGVDDRAGHKISLEIEALIALTAVEELTHSTVRSLAEAALIRLGMHTVANTRAALRIDRTSMDKLLGGNSSSGGSSSSGKDGLSLVLGAGRMVLGRWAAQTRYPNLVARHLSSGRLWVDGLDDPQRGSQWTEVLGGGTNPWQVLTQALVTAHEAHRSWRRVRLVLPPAMLGHLERGAAQFISPIEALATVAQVYLACDGRTPLLERWPFLGHRNLERRVLPVSVAVAQDDFLLFRQLQELGLPQLAGPHLFEPGWCGRVGVELAINAQGLDQDFTFMDGLAMALASAAKVRRDQLGSVADGSEFRFAIFGLPHHSPSREYLERQVVQEGLRCGLSLTRSVSLSEEACTHLGRVME